MVNKYPAIPAPTAEVHALRSSALSVKETVEILTRQRGQPGQAAVTFNDLVTLGLITSSQLPTGPGTDPKPAAAAASPLIPKGYLFGLTLSTAGGVSTFGIAVGSATDSTYVSVMDLLTAYTKTTAGWAVGTGNGALDAGSIAASTWYHVHLIKRLDTSVVDVLVSLSATAPTLPAGYTLFRRLGSMKTDASSHWILFTQNNDEFLWVSPFNDFVADTTMSTTPKAYVISVPTGVIVNALGYWYFTNTSAGILALLYPVATSSIPTGGSFGNAYWDIDVATAASVNPVAAKFNIRTNTSAQVEAACNAVANNQIWITTTGWIDTRGRRN